MNNINEVGTNCYGCGACKQICHNNAISMSVGKKGFLFPTIDKKKCTSCKACIKVCPVYKETKTINEVRIYAAKSKTIDILRRSSSGGMFITFSDYILSKGGVVFAATYNYSEHKLEHTMCNTYEDREKMVGSKYLQSEISTTYIKVVEVLNKGTMVLFVGTPCQVEGLNNFLKFKRVDCTNLYTLDLICHGVGSPVFWKKYIRGLENKNKTKFNKITFKDKRRGWKRPTALAIDKDNNEYSLRGYTQLYFDNDIMRESCHKCKFTTTQRGSDITIGDFWSIKKTIPEMFDHNGVSLLLINNSKGKILFQKIKSDIDFCESTLEDCMQNNLKRPTSKGPYYEQFWKDYNTKDIKFVIIKWDIKLKINKVLSKIKMKDWARTSNKYKISN